MPVSSLWALYNLRESPFFQDQLTADPNAHYPIQLFVAREAEVRQLVQGVTGRGSASSRQAVHGPPGVGKSTLVQEVKFRLAAQGVLSSPHAVRLGHADSTRTVLQRIVGYVHAAILAAAPTDAIGDREPMVAARQLTKAFQSQAGGFGVGFSGASLSGTASTQFVRPPDNLEVGVPELLRELMQLVRDDLRRSGVLVHLNNLEQISEEDEQKAAMVLRDIRDDVLMEPGFHFILAGTSDAVRHVVTEHAQLRTVFTLRPALTPLSLPEVRALLARRYEHLGVDRKKAVRPPVADEALSLVYETFSGDLRGLLLALSDAAESLIELGASGGEPMQAEDIFAVLAGRYRDELSGQLSEGEVTLLAEIAAAHGDQAFTQKQMRELPSRPSQGRVSELLAALIRVDYVQFAGTGESRGGRPAQLYRLAPVPRIALSARS